jgi:hypothetical protein
LGLVCFYDKTHTDLFGSLSCAPFIATFSFFNKTCRNNHKFYAVLGYVPNLKYGHGKSNSKKTVDNVKDEHKFLRLITDQIENLNKLGGFHTYILGKKVTVKTWIHFIAGDTLGHNNLIEQFNSSKALQPYLDCHCLLEELSKPSSKCALITIEEYKFSKQAQILHAYSLHAFDNAFYKTPFADQVHGIFGCLPAEMLHVTGNGIMKYQLEVVKQIFESGSRKLKNYINLTCCITI